MEIDDRLAGAAVQVRVVQGQEPSHFLAIFHGKMVIYQGGLSSSFDGKKKSMLEENTSFSVRTTYICIPLYLIGDAAENVEVSDTFMLQVHGRTPLTTKGTQVALKAASLNTNDCFVIKTKTQGTWVWLGKGSTGDERDMAKNIAQMSDNDPTITMEGKYLLFTYYEVNIKFGSQCFQLFG